MDCAVANMAEQQAGFKAGTDPRLAASVQAGYWTAAQIKQRSGPDWDRWAGGMARYVSTLTTTEGAPPDTIPDNRAAEARPSPEVKSKRGRYQRRSKHPGPDVG